MSVLTVTQRKAIRRLYDEPGAKVAAPTIHALTKRGLVRGEEGVGPVLTATGQAAYDRIMESGDGPEDLKEMFRVER